MPQGDPSAAGAQRPLISVIIPVFDDQQTLNKCLTGLRVQTYPRARTEIIVIDNGSRPAIELPAWATALARLIGCEKPGAYAARNRGVAVSSGEILAFTDADCIPEPRWIEAGVEAVTERHGDAPVGGEIILFSEHALVCAVERYQLLTGFYQRENITRRAFGVTANLFVDRRLFEQIGPFDENLLSGGDREWGWRAQRQDHAVAYAPKAIVRHPCRTSLRGLIRQARRVAGGRLGLGGYAGGGRHAVRLRPHRRPAEALRWLLGHPELRGAMRVKVIAVASVIWVARALETTRLYLGGAPLR